MSYYATLTLVSVALLILTGVMLFAIAAMAQSRGVTTGPVVIIARVLFVVCVMLVCVIIVGLIGGVATSWA